MIVFRLWNPLVKDVPNRPTASCNQGPTRPVLLNIKTIWSISWRGSPHRSYSVHYSGELQWECGQNAYPHFLLCDQLGAKKNWTLCHSCWKSLMMPIYHLESWTHSRYTYYPIKFSLVRWHSPAGLHLNSDSEVPLTIMICRSKWTWNPHRSKEETFLQFSLK